jgi:thioredoxin 1
MMKMPTMWRPVAVGAALVGLPAVLALCGLSGRCGAQTAENRPPTAGAASANLETPIQSQGEPNVTTQTREARSGGRVEHADARNFQRMVMEAEMPVLVDFYADWCGPCRMLAPVLDELAREMPEARIVKVNVDHSPELAARYNVNSIPTLIAFRDGRQTAQAVGLASKSQLRKMLGGD